MGKTGLGKAWNGLLGETRLYKDMKAEGWVSVEDVYQEKKTAGWSYSSTYRRLQEMAARGELEFQTAYKPSGHQIGIYRPKGGTPRPGSPRCA